MPKQQFPTRPWRAIHDSWLSSERLGGVTDSAIVMFHMLNTRQDDSGRFPWTPVMVRSLTAVRPWSFAQATRFLHELASAGIVTLSGDWVTLRRGADMNGTPTSGSKESLIPRFYQQYTNSIPSVESESTVGTMKQVERKQVETNRERSKRVSILAVSLLDWATYLSEHWQPFVTDDWQSDIVTTFPMINLLTESKKCVDWWASQTPPKPKEPKRPALAFRNWCEKTMKIMAAQPPALFRPGPSANGSLPRTPAVVAAQTEELRRFAKGAMRQELRPEPPGTREERGKGVAIQGQEHSATPRNDDVATP